MKQIYNKGSRRVLYNAGKSISEEDITLIKIYSPSTGAPKYIKEILTGIRASLVAQTVKNLPAMWETWVQSLGWEDPLEKEKIPSPLFQPGEFHGLQSPWACKESDTTEPLSNIK